MTKTTKTRPSDRSEDKAAGLEFRPSVMEFEDRQLARRLRKRDGLDVPTIAARMGKTEPEIISALGAIRGHRKNADHISLAVSRVTGEFYRDQALPGEATWQTMERIAVFIRRMKRLGHYKSPPRKRGRPPAPR